MVRTAELLGYIIRKPLRISIVRMNPKPPKTNTALAMSVLEEIIVMAVTIIAARMRRARNPDIPLVSFSFIID